MELIYLDFGTIQGRMASMTLCKAFYLRFFSIFGLILAVSSIVPSCSSRTAENQNTVTSRVPTPTPESPESGSEGHTTAIIDAEYSLPRIRENFKEASVVVLAKVTAMKPDNMDRGYRPYTSTAEIKEVFKGNVTKGQIIKVRSVMEVYDKELVEEDFLSERVLWLHQRLENDEMVFGMIEFMAQEVRPNFLEKIRTVARSKTRRK